MLSVENRTELERLCIENLLTAAEERVFFKDLAGRYLMVSAGWLAADGGARPLEDVIGRTDYELFTSDYARAAEADERRVIETGQPIVAKLERQLSTSRPPAWISTSRLPLRGRDGAIIGTFGTTRDATAHVEIHDALVRQALHDPMTGLPNRVALMDRLAQALVALERRPGWVGVLFIDLDGFKQINDTYGHDVGDEVLLHAGERLLATARRVDTVARLGGDELVVLCPSLGTPPCLGTVASRLVGALAEPLGLDAGSVVLSGSVGAAATNDAGLEPGELLRRADLAMYAAKRAGGNGFAVYDERAHGRPRVRRSAAGQPARRGVGAGASASAA